MKCEHCGAIIDEACNFCPVCGSKIDKIKSENQENRANSDSKKAFSDFLNFNKNNKDPLNEENPEQKLRTDDLGEKETSKSHQDFTVKDENEGENPSDEDQKEAMIPVKK